MDSILDQVAAVISVYVADVFLLVEAEFVDLNPLVSKWFTSFVYHTSY